MRIINSVLQLFGLMTVNRSRIFAAELVSAVARDITHRVALGEHHRELKKDLKRLYIVSASEQFDELLLHASTIDSKVEVLNDWEVG